MGIEKGVRKLLMTSSTSEEAPNPFEEPPNISLFSSFGLTSDRTATLLTNFPTDESVSKPRSARTSLTQSLNIAFKGKNKMAAGKNLIMLATTEEVTKGGSGLVGNFLP